MRARRSIRHPAARSRAAVALAIATLLVAVGPASGASPSPAPSPGAGPSASPAAPDDWSIADLFSALANPLTLATTTAPKKARTKVIGPKGGTITARLPDGTTAALEIPEGALAFPTAITVTPVTRVDGFPEGVTVEHAVGVELMPDGLRLALPATLTITPADPTAEAPVVALGFHGDGSETGFQAFDEQAGKLTLEVDHFSGYVAAYPVDDGEVRVLARQLQTLAEDRLTSEIAALLSFEAQRQKFGLPPNFDLKTLATNYYRDYLEIILKPRVAMAGRGCTEADAALTAFAAYERWRQKAGLGEDPEFTPYGVEWIQPPKLIDLDVRLCFREAHAFCVRTGDFPGLLVYFAATFGRNRSMLGIDPTAEQLALAHGYLKRCGRYRVTAHLEDIEADVGDFARKEAFGLEVELEWKPGSGEFGIIGSTVEGEGEHRDIDLAFGSAGCRQVISVTRTDRPPRAQLETLAFDRPFGPTLTGQPIPPQPSRLTLLLDLGVVGYQYKCDGPAWNDNEPTSTAMLFVLGLLSEGDAEAGVTTVAHLSDRWQFSMGPFRAERQQKEPIKGGGRLLSTLVLDATLVHEPG